MGHVEGHGPNNQTFKQVQRMSVLESSAHVFRPIISTAFPELSGSRFSVLETGWDCTAVDVDAKFIFKFPRHDLAAMALRKEASLLAIIRPAITMAVPNLTLYPGPPLFSGHAKIPGEHLLRADYDRLPERARQRLATDLAMFHGELHRLDQSVMKEAGAGPIRQWLSPDEILRKMTATLPSGLWRLAERTLSAWEDLPPDPHGTTYGFFDGHGWNMAFDHQHKRLNGIYDFADSGFGALHQEFVYSSFVEPDLTDRICSQYEALTGRVLDRERIAVLTGVHRLWELAEAGDDPDHALAMMRNVKDWATRQQ